VAAQCYCVAVILPSTCWQAKSPKSCDRSFVPAARQTLIAGAGAKPDHNANLWVGIVGVQFQSREDFDWVVVDE
jgi:hypothetical protein